jgi:hypothetical protein
MPLEFGRAPAPEALAPALLDARVRRLGGRSAARERLEGALPWAISIVGHLLLGAVVLLLGWSFVFERPAEEPILVIADFEEIIHLPLAGVDADSDTTPLLPAPPPALPEPVVPQAAPPAPRPAPSAVAPAIDWSPPVGREVSFAGVRGGDVRRIAYVVDASGSMVGSLSLILDELERSLRGLSSDQQFVLLFFQRNEAVAAPPGDRFVPASAEQIDRTLRWARQRIVPAGRSNPMKALESALRLRPDAIFLLSTSITGSGQFEIDQQELLRRLDRANPADGSGRRRSQIHCIQFLDPDPLDTLRRISGTHGGPGSYRFLSRAELGVAPR